MKRLLLFSVVILYVIAAYAQTQQTPAQKRAALLNQQSRAEMVVVMNDTGFTHKVVNVVPGRETHVSVSNLGKSPHGLRIKIGKQEFGPTQPIGPGQHVEFTFTPPKDSAGTGEFYSPLEADKKNPAFRGRVLPGSPWGEGG